MSVGTATNAHPQRSTHSTTLVLLVCGVGLGAPVRAETLAEALAEAYQSNPTLESQRSQLQATDEDYVQAEAGFRPTVSAQSSINYTQQPANNLLNRGQQVEFNSGNAVLTLAQPLYTGGRTTARIGAAEAAIRAGREQLRLVEANVLLGVIQAYSDVLRDRASLAIQKDSLKILQDATNEITARFEAGANTRTDVAQAEAQLEASRALVASAQAQYEISVAAYAAAVGRSPGNLDVPPPLPAEPASLDEAFSISEQESPTIRQAEFNEAITRAQVQEARAGNRPAVSLNASIGYSGPIAPFDTRNYDRSVSVTATLNQPIFTGGTIQSQVRQATARDTSARVQVEAARRSALQAVSQAWSLSRAAHLNTTNQTAQVRAAQIALEGVRIEFRAGLRGTLDVLIAQETLRGAQIALVDAQRDEYVANASVLQAVGRLEARVLIRGVPLYNPETSFKRIRHAGAVPWEVLPAGLDKIGAPGIPQPGPLPQPEGPPGAIRMNAGNAVVGESPQRR